MTYFSRSFKISTSVEIYQFHCLSKEEFFLKEVIYQEI